MQNNILTKLFFIYLSRMLNKNTNNSNINNTQIQKFNELIKKIVSDEEERKEKNNILMQMQKQTQQLQQANISESKYSD